MHDSSHAAERALSAAFARLRAAERAEPYPDRAARRARLDALAALIRTHEAALAAAVDEDFGGRSPVETRLLELFPTLAGIRYARRRLGRWMRAERRGVSPWFAGARADVRPVPLGVVGIIVPWNYPVFLALGPLTDALAAGNRVMLKLPEHTPATAALLSELIARYFGPDLVVAVGGNAALAEAFARLPFDHLLFTGSTAAGRHVMRAASANLTPLTLELGGKSPALVLPDADLAHAAERIVVGKLVNGGQTCVAPDYALVPADRVEAFAAHAERVAARLYPRLAGNLDYTAIAGERHYRRLVAWRDAAREAGAAVREVWPAGEDRAACEAARKLPLTLLLEAPADCAALREEIFGPLLPVVGYRDEADALERLRAQPAPLALYLFGRERAGIERALAATRSGGVTINDTLVHVGQPSLPFGGSGPSGFGQYHGREGFLAFSQRRPVLRQPRRAMTRLLRPPYGAWVARLLRLLLR